MFFLFFVQIVASLISRTLFLPLCTMPGAVASSTTLSLYLSSVTDAAMSKIERVTGTSDVKINACALLLCVLVVGLVALKLSKRLMMMKKKKTEGENNGESSDSDDDEEEEEDEEEEKGTPTKISNLDDLNAIKRAYEELFCDGLLQTERIKETHFVSNMKILIGSVACAFAFVAQFYPMYLKKKDGGKYDVKFHEDSFLQQLTFLCVCGYVITNSILTAFVLFCERGVLFWGEYYEEEDEEEGEGKGKDDTKKKKSSDNSTDAKLVGHKVCARIHHMRFSPNLTLELVSRELLSNGVVKKMDKEKKVKTKDGKVILPTCSGRVMKVVNVTEYVYTDGVFAESSYLDMVEQFVIEYEQSLEKKDK